MGLIISALLMGAPGMDQQIDRRTVGLSLVSLACAFLQDQRGWEEEHQLQVRAKKPGTTRPKSCKLTIFCDDDICVGAAVFVDVINGFLDTVHHFNAHFQVTIFYAE